MKVVRVSVFQKIIILCCILVLSSTHAMECEHELISFKSLYGAPLISLHNGKQWFATLSQEKQQRICDQIESQKNKGLTALLHMVALPQDIQKSIVAHLFENGECHKAADIFCKIPLCDALNRYQVSRKIVQNPEAFSFYKESSFPLHVIFEYADDIKVYHKTMEYHDIGYSSRKELESLERVMRVFKNAVGRTRYLKYQFYNKHITFDHIKKEFCDQMLLLPIVISAYIFLMFPLRWQRVCNRCNIEYNAAADDLNKAISVFNDKVGYLRQITGGDYEYCSYTYKQEEEPIIWHGAHYKKWSGVLGVTWIAFLLGLKHREIDRAVGKFGDKNSSQKVRSILTTLSGMCGVYTTMSCIAAQFEENSFYGVGCMTSLYMLLCSCYNVYKVKSLQEDEVSSWDIQPLLQRISIEII